LAFTSLGGTGTESDLLVSWPAAEIGFMDPHVAANVLHADELAQLPPAERRQKRLEFASVYARDTDPYAIARGMGIDEIIHPNETRSVLSSALRRTAGWERPQAGSPLQFWPTCW
jgi:acetyl-CoA carboxylase carboxyltransferase component